MDREAKRRWDADQWRIPGVVAPADVQELGRITVHVVDVPAEVAFYRSVLGIDEVGGDGADGVLLGLDDTVVLQISPGGSIQPVIEDRSEADDAWLVRVRDLDLLLDRLRAARIPILNEPFLSGTETVMYVTDPEGHVLGFNDSVGSEWSPVGAEARRRWEERRPAVSG